MTTDLINISYFEISLYFEILHRSTGKCHKEGWLPDPRLDLVYPQTVFGGFH